MNAPRRFGMGVIATGVVCPCHVLAWIAGLLNGAPVLSPAVQDGLHAVYVPLAVLVGAALLRVRSREPSSTIMPRERPSNIMPRERLRNT